MRQSAPTLIERAKWAISMKEEAPTAALAIPVSGFDISKWTVIKDASQALAGMTFAIIRARDGIRDDSSWTINKALVRSLPHWGAYAYFNPRFFTNEADGGAKQAGDFWTLVKPAIQFDGLDIPLVIDVEPAPSYTMPPASRYFHELKYYVEAMIGYMGRKPIIYSNLSFLNDYLRADVDVPNSTWEAERNKQWLRDCPLWIARPTTLTYPGLPRAWTKWVFLQYKLDNSAHPGLSVCDENYWAGSLAQLAAWCASDSAPIPVWGEVDPNPPPPPPPPPADDLTARVAALEAAVVELQKPHIHSLQPHTHEIGPAI